MKHLTQVLCLFLTLQAPLASAFFQGSGQEAFFQMQGTQLEVLSETGAPLAGARIMVGYAVNDPFQGNVFTTSKTGTIEIPSLWKTPLPVTISADGHLTTTFVDSQPMGRSFVLQRAETDAMYELNGVVSGFGELRKDGKVDVGFVMPAFNRRELLGFDISSVMSPESDTITILNREVQIPSNISLPQQQETYSFPITLNKPSYRIYTRHTGPKKFVTGHAQFPLKRVVDKIRGGKSILEVINDFSFLGGSISNVEMAKAPVTKNMAVNEFRYTDKVMAKGISLPPTKVMFAVAAVENNGDFFPTDLKLLESNQNLELTTVNSKGAVYIASMLANKPEEKVKNLEQWNFIDPHILSPLALVDLFIQKPLLPENTAPNLSQMSITLQKYQAGMAAPDFLSLVPAPVVREGQLDLTPPAASSQIVPIGTVVVFSEVETIQQGDISTEKRTRLWEIFAPHWTNRVILPDIETNLVNKRTHRWEVIYLGKKVGSSQSGGLDAVTHISRNSVNLN
jgi:hypothetical protein